MPGVSDEQRGGGLPESDKTMQVDALVEEVPDELAGDGEPYDDSLPPQEPGAMPVVSKPPPLPKKKSKTPMIILGVFVAILAVGAAIGIAQVMFSGPEPVAPAAPPPAVAAPTKVATPAPTPEPSPAEPAQPEGEPRRLMLDEDFVIGSEEPAPAPPQ